MTILGEFYFYKKCRIPLIHGFGRIDNVLQYGKKKKKKTELLYLTLVIDEIYSAGAENINILVESSHIMYMIGPILQPYQESI